MLVFVQLELIHAGLHQLLGVVGVENRVVVAEADFAGVLAQQPVGEMVERSAEHTADAAAGQIVGAVEHFAGRLVGEGEQQNTVRIDALFDQPCDAVNQRAGFAGSGGGDHERRPVRSGHGGVLLFIQFFAEIHRAPIKARPAARMNNKQYSMLNKQGLKRFEI